MTIAVGLIVVLVAAAIQGMTSFGFSLITVPILGMFLPLKILVPILIIYNSLSNIMIAVQVRKNMQLRKIALLAIAGIIAIPLGTYVLLVVPQKTLQVITGITVIIAALALFSGYKAKTNNPLATVFAGLTSGVLGGSISTSGPPIVLFFSSQGAERDVFRANLVAYFLILNVMTISSHIVSGLFTMEVVKQALVWLPALVGGVLLGMRVADKVPEELFRKLTLGLIAISGVLAVVTGLN